MQRHRIIIVGGGAAGFFAAITAAEANPAADVTILEKGPRFLDKVRISGGGRCNVTHACFDPIALARHYPRGERELRAPFTRFGPRQTIDWFAARGVALYTQEDGCLFPETDRSQTIIDCLLEAARKARVNLRTLAAPSAVERNPAGGFALHLPQGERLECERLLLATGGCRVASMGILATSLGHTLEPPVPSLFTFHIEVEWLRRLAGAVIDDVQLSTASAGLKDRGILLLTHWGVSGPVVLKLSAWGARKLAALSYRFTLQVNWLPALNLSEVQNVLEDLRQAHPARLIVNTPLAPLTARLWESLVLAAGIDKETRWSQASRAQQHKLAQMLTRTELPVTGKSLNKEEFVTCGGVRLREVNFKTMGSRLCPGLHFAGELLDIDGLTGGFNFQAAWTTGWIAGQAMAGA